MNGKVTSFIIAAMVTSLVAGLLALFMGGMNGYYPVAGYDSSRIEAYNKLNDLTANVHQVQQSTDQLKQQSGIFDMVGGMFSDAYQSLKVAFSSYDLFNSMLDQGTKDANLGASGILIKNTISAIMLVILFIGVLISAVLRMDL